MNSIVLARLDLYRMDAHDFMVIYQVVHLALLTIVVIEKFMSMGTKFLGNDTLINGTEIDTAHIFKHRAYVVVIKQTCQQPHIIQIEFQQIFLK